MFDPEALVAALDLFLNWQTFLWMIIGVFVGTGVGAIAIVIKTAVLGPSPMPAGMEDLSGVGGAVLFGILLFVVSLGIAPALGAVGGLIFAAVKRD